LDSSMKHEEFHLQLLVLFVEVKYFLLKFR
jgi:hypothetical protein